MHILFSEHLHLEPDLPIAVNRISNVSSQVIIQSHFVNQTLSLKSEVMENSVGILKSEGCTL